MNHISLIDALNLANQNQNKETMTDSEKKISDDRPPVFSTWRQMYIFVLALHVFILSLFYTLTQHFA